MVVSNRMPRYSSMMVSRAIAAGVKTFVVSGAPPQIRRRFDTPVLCTGWLMCGGGEGLKRPETRLPALPPGVTFIYFIQYKYFVYFSSSYVVNSLPLP